MDMSLDPRNLESLFEMSRDAIMGIQDKKILFLNPSASALFGAAIGDDAEKYIPNYILSDPADRFLTTMTVYGLSCQVSSAREGDLTILSVMIHQEATPVPAHLNRALRDLSGNLFSAKLAIDILINKTKADGDPKLRDYASALYRDYYSMKRTCEHLTMANALVQGTLPFLPKTVLLDHLFRDVCNTASYFTTEMGIQLVFIAESGIYQTLADPELLQVMLLNLLSNSISHSSPDSIIEVKLSSQGNRFILSINDQGTGIPTGKLPHIYKPDVSADMDSGAGLGLSIARGIAEQHEGALVLESREGVGTKLRVSLPINTPKELTFHDSAPTYKTNGMDSYLTEFSVILDKKFYNKTMFD